MNSVLGALTHHGALDEITLVVKGEIDDVLGKSLRLTINVDCDGSACSPTTMPDKPTNWASGEAFTVRLRAKKGMWMLSLI